MKPLDNLNRFLYNRTKGAIPPPQPEESNTMKIERKISFTVAGIEFDNLKTAQFFKRAITLHLQDLDPIDGIDERREAHMMLNLWAEHLPSLTTDELIETVMALQLPKPARKKKETEFEMIPDSDIYSNPLN